MELFNLILPAGMKTGGKPAQKYTELFANEVGNQLHTNKQNGSNLDQLVKLEARNDTSLICRANLSSFQLVKHGDLAYHKAANAIASYILEELEDNILAGMIEQRYKSFSKHDKDEVRRFSKEVLHGGDECDGFAAKFKEADFIRRKKKIALEVEQYLQLETDLHLEGFITFRLKEYREELAEIIDYAYDEYILDKQYQEFISLIKYFVYLQETKVEMVHLFHRGGQNFQMYDEHYQLIEEKHASDRIVAEMIETEMNMDDMVINHLISVSPKRIVVHSKHPKQSIIRTIASIFEDRVSICQNCAACSSMLDEITQR